MRPAADRLPAYDCGQYDLHSRADIFGATPKRPPRHQRRAPSGDVTSLAIQRSFGLIKIFYRPC
jgi:hypothetical protein